MNAERWIPFLMCVLGVVEGVTIFQRGRDAKTILEWLKASREREVVYAKHHRLSRGPRRRSFQLLKADFKIVFIYTGQKSGAEAACLHLIPKRRHSEQFHLHHDLLC